jgi:CYRIA/CYRIB Rac1 binding domain
VLPKILSEICSGEMIPTQHLETQQALVKQFAEILEFVLKFDENKVRLDFNFQFLPIHQNDVQKIIIICVCR